MNSSAASTMQRVPDFVSPSCRSVRSRKCRGTITAMSTTPCYVLAGSIRIFLQDPKEDVRLAPGQTFAVPPGRPHLVTNPGDTSAVFFVLQGIGEYDFVPLT
jgi:Cupin domain